MKISLISQDAATQHWFRLIVEAAPNAMLVVNNDSQILLVNRGAENLFGYGRDELVGQSIETLVPNQFRSRHHAHVNAFFTDPKVRVMGAGRELFGLHKDGSQIPIEIGLNPFETPQGHFTLASVIDISERKRADRRFRLVVEAAPYAMLMADNNGKITLVNRKTEDLFGYPRAELIGQSLEQLIPERFRAGHPALVQSFTQEPAARAMGAGRELFGRRKDGGEVPIEIGLNPIKTDDGEFTLAAIIDITERKRHDDELRRSNSELEQFAYVASHDLQEPLRMVANYTELLGQRYQGKLDEKADKYIHYAVDGAKRMQRLVSDLLAYSRVGSQGKALVAVDAEAAAKIVLKSLGSQTRAANATINIGPLPTVLADESQLHQLLQNLIGNAIKFHGTESPLIEVSASRHKEGWLFSVKDNGIGIDEKYSTRVFQMFQRLHELGKYEGSGIGLSIAKRIVERHGGHIWYTSQPGLGTTFFFTLQPAPATCAL